MSVTTRQAASAYAKAGWHVFPVRARGKEPLTQHGLNDASTDAAAIEEWWTRWPDANIGVATGKISGFLAVDLDGSLGMSSWFDLEMQHGSAPTLEAITGGGGRHLIYKLNGVDLPNTARKLGPGIDTRGTGGYVVMAPSVHPSGTLYAWSPGPSTVAPVPAWVTASIRPAPVRAAAVSTAWDFDGTPYGKAALRSILTRFTAIGEGGRNNALNEAAFQLGSLIGGGELTSSALTVLRDAAHVAGLTAREVSRTIDSGMKAGLQHPRTGERRNR